MSPVMPLTLADAAERMGIDPPALSQLKTGKNLV